MPITRSTSVLLIGGCSEAKEAGALRSLEEVTFSCSSSGINIVSQIAGNLNQLRRSPAVLRGKDGIYVIGGCSEEGCHLNTMEKIILRDGEQICCAVQDLLDVEQRSCAAFCNLDRRHGLIIGGFDGTDCLKIVALIQENNHEVYLKRLNDLPFRLKNSAAISVSDDVILVIGGWDESSTMRTIFRLELDRERDSYLIDMESLLPYAVEAHCCISHHGYIYIIGGYDGLSVVNTIVRYSIAAKSPEVYNLRGGPILLRPAPRRQRSSQPKDPIPCCILPERIVRHKDHFSKDSEMVLPIRLATARENHVCEIVLEKYLAVMVGWDGRRALDSAEVFEIVEEYPYLNPVNVEFKLSQKRNRPASVVL